MEEKHMMADGSGLETRYAWCLGQAASLDSAEELEPLHAEDTPIVSDESHQSTKVNTFAEYSYGGKKYAFTDPVGRMLECPICQGVVKEAQSVRCCKKTFCKSCLGEALKRFTKCPLCRTEYPVTYENDAIDDGVNDLQVLCLHHGKGCEWSGHLLHEPQHREEKCGYEEVECENHESVLKCEVVCERRYLKKHMEEECVYREVPCKYCRESQRAILMQGHLSCCPEHPVECVNGCRVEGLLHKNIAAHLEACPEAVGDCPFKEMGCSEGQLKRKDMQSHTTNAVSDHLALVMKNLVETKQHCEQALQKQADAHKTETDCLKANIEWLEAEADVRQKEIEDHVQKIRAESKANYKTFKAETEGLKAHLQQLQHVERHEAKVTTIAKFGRQHVTHRRHPLKSKRFPPT